ncbi:MAG TPA: thymidine kinase, partial [Sphaerochaeta sp.]|nr:thymidine kinase [Sphaerochaeta sp.]
HHYLPGKEYTFFHLKPLGEKASRGDEGELVEELAALKGDIKRSRLYENFTERFGGKKDEEILFNALKVDNIAEKALAFLFFEQNLIAEQMLLRLASQLDLDTAYLEKVLSDNKRPVSFAQPFLF